MRLLPQACEGAATRRPAYDLSLNKIERMNRKNLPFWSVTCLFALALAFKSCKDKAQSEHPQQSSEVVQEPAFDPTDEILGLSESWSGDLDGMVERGRVRALVPYNRTSYFIDGTRRGGITYEAMILFEEKLNERLGKKPGAPGYVQVVFIPMTRDRILPALLEGYGDIAAANLVITEKRQEVVAYSEPILNNWRELVVSGPAARPLARLEDLLGDTVYVRRSSSYYEHLENLNDSLQGAGKPEIAVKTVDEHLEDDDILEMVNAGLIPITVINGFTAKLWEPMLEDIRVHENLAIKTGGEVAWAMRKNNPRLKEAADAILKENKQGTLMGNILLKKYLEKRDYISKANSKEAQNRFVELRALFIKYGTQYNIDWLLLAAQGYQESQLDQSKRSPAGAVGIMQIKPSTAADPNVGIDNVYDKENNIHAAAKYLDFLRSRYFSDPGINPLNAMLFSLAAYNMGPGRMSQILKKTAAQGLNPNEWFGQVELVTAREVGREPVQYVSNIYKYYTSFRSLQRYSQKTGKSLD